MWDGDSENCVGNGVPRREGRREEAADSETRERRGCPAEYGNEEPEDFVDDRPALLTLMEAVPALH